MKNNYIVFVLIILLLIGCVVIILTTEDSSPVEYFLWGFVGGLLLFYSIVNIIRERKRQKSTDLLQRLHRLAVDGLKSHGTGHSGAYTIGYNVAMHDIQQFVHKEWRNIP